VFCPQNQRTKTKIKINDKNKKFRVSKQTKPNQTPLKKLLLKKINLFVQCLEGGIGINIQKLVSQKPKNLCKLCLVIEFVDF